MDYVPHTKEFMQYSLEYSYPSIFITAFVWMEDKFISSSLKSDIMNKGSIAKIMSSHMCNKV